MGKGLEWEHVVIVKEASTSGQARVRCEYCKHLWTGGADRIRAHIVGVKGIGVAKCDKAPAHVYDQMARILEKNELKKAKDADATFEPEDARAAIQELRRESFASMETAGGLSLSSVYDNNVSRKRRQEDVVEGGSAVGKLFRHSYRNATDEAQRRLFYGCGIAYNVAHSKLFKDYVKAVVKAGVGYQPLSYGDLNDKHLQAEYKVVEQRLKPVRETWTSYGVSICSDGWSDVKKRPIINFIASNWFGSMFLKSVDASGKKKDAKFLYDEHVVQVITDNGSNCVKAGQMLEWDYPSIFFTRCACHTLDLLFEDIGRLDWVLPMVRGAEKIGTFLMRKESGISLWFKFCKKKLLKLAATRFACMFIVMEQLSSDEVEKALVKMIMSDEWSAWTHLRKPAGQEVYGLIRSVDFFTQAKEIVYILTPLLKALRLVDREGSTMGLIYECMDHLIEVLDGMKGKVDASKFESIINCIKLPHDGLEARWEMMHSPLHGVRFLVNPPFREGPEHAGALHDEDLTKDWWDFLPRYTNDDLQLQTKLNAQLRAFRNPVGIGGLHNLPASELREQMLTPLQWWQSFGGSLPELRTLAMRVLGQGTSSSPCERIVTKKRNRLLSSNAEKLVLIHTKLRLLENLEKSAGEMIEGNYDKIDLEKNEERLLVVEERVNYVLQSATPIQPALLLEMDPLSEGEDSEEVSTYVEEADSPVHDDDQYSVHDDPEYESPIEDNVNENVDEDSPNPVPRRTRSIRDLT